MPVTLNIEHPEHNSIDLAPEFIAQSRGIVTILGRGNRLVVERPLIPNDAHFVIAGGATVIARMDSNLSDLRIHALDGSYVDIGAWCSFNSQCQVSAHEKSTILIGMHCLFGAATRIASSDVHKIFDRQTGVRLNSAGDIIIGEHVWVSPGCLILRNTIIGRGCIVGAGSIVRDTFPAHVMIAGVPAKIQRQNVVWEF